jgi:arylsulfatase A-like enzyme/Tfp pilus assembly protein PilF
MKRRLTPRGVLPALTVLAGLTLACSPASEEVGVLPTGTPVVLISIDTLRADRLPAYGYTQVATPAIDALRADSILFENAYSHTPLTLPSHTSMLTGLLPAEHGLRDNLGESLADVDEKPFLPRALKEAGYSTGAMVSTLVLQRNTGLSDHFDLYNDTADMLAKFARLYRRGDETLAEATAWLDTVADDPFFLFFHLYDAHTPYEPVAPYDQRYEDPYDAEVAYSDEVIGGLMTHLRQLEVYDDALIILVSDHGEGLGDHGEYEHGVFVYRSTQHIPLLVKLPGGTKGGTSVSRPVGLVDLYPTIAELLGLPQPEDLAGFSLLSEEVDPARNIYAETFYARAHLGWAEVTSLIGERYQYIDAPRPELYDLLADPEETNDLIQIDRQAAARLREELSGYDREYVAAEYVDDEKQQQLAALGYVGTVVDVGDGPRSDPKDRIHVLRQLKEANMRFHSKDYEGSAAAFRKVLESEPQMLDARETLAKALQLGGRPEEALVTYQEALTLSKGKPQIALAIASVLMGMKRLDEAEQHALLAVDDLEALHLLGEIAVLQEDFAKAEDYLARARAQDDAPLPQTRLEASIALGRGDYASAIDLTQQAEQMIEGRPSRKTLTGVFFMRAKAQVQLGLTDEAEASFLEEIEIGPAQLGPYTHLALLYAVQGRGTETGRTLQRMVETNPNPLAYAEAVRTLKYIGDPGSANALLGHALSRWPDSTQLRSLAAS